MAFGAFELDQYIAARQINGSPADYILSAAQGLSRDVRPSGHASMVVEYQSRKMGVTVNAESRTAEYVYVLKLESDDSVIAYYEQPPAVEVRRLTRRGYKRLTPYHPDMLVLRTDGPEVIQVKPLATLEELVATKSDWIKLSDGTFQDLPAHEALAAKGLRHLVVPIDASDRQRAANIALMLAALRCPDDDCDLEARAAVFLEKHGLLTLAELSRELEQRDYTPLIRLIANHRLYTNLDQYSLSHPETCVVARAPEMLVESFVQAWQELALCRQDQLGTTTTCDLQWEKHLKEALAKLEALASSRNDRSARRWREQIRKAEAEGTSAVVALSRGYRKRGNRESKRPEQTAFATEYIRERWGGEGKDRPAVPCTGPTTWRQRLPYPSHNRFPDQPSTRCSRVKSRDSHSSAVGTAPEMRPCRPPM